MLLIGNATLGVLTLGLPTSVYFFYNQRDPQKMAALIAQSTLLLLACGLLASLLVFFGATSLSAS